MVSSMNCAGAIYPNRKNKTSILPVSKCQSSLSFSIRKWSFVSLLPPCFSGNLIKVESPLCHLAAPLHRVNSVLTGELHLDWRDCDLLKVQMESALNVDVSHCDPQKLGLWALLHWFPWTWGSCGPTHVLSLPHTCLTLDCFEAPCLGCPASMLRFLSIVLP